MTQLLHCPVFGSRSGNTDITLLIASSFHYLKIIVGPTPEMVLYFI